MGMLLNVYAGPLIEIVPGGELCNYGDLMEFTHDVLEHQLWAPETKNKLFLLPNTDDLNERSYYWTGFDENQDILNPNLENDKAWFSEQLKDIIAKFPPDTEYEVGWGVISYWN